MVVTNIHGIFTGCINYHINTMNFTNAVFMAVKRKITRISWLFNDFLISVGFIVQVKLIFIKKTEITQGDCTTLDV